MSRKLIVIHGREDLRKTVAAEAPDRRDRCPAGDARRGAADQFIVTEKSVKEKVAGRFSVEQISTP